jgi:hypothetical protein
MSGGSVDGDGLAWDGVSISSSSSLLFEEEELDEVEDEKDEELELLEDLVFSSVLRCLNFLKGLFVLLKGPSILLAVSIADWMKLRSDSFSLILSNIS